MKIAICDDCIRDTEVLQKEIQEQGLFSDSSIFTFSGGIELLEFLETHICDVVFLDIDMPEINGIELGKSIYGKYPNIHIIFVTSYPEYALEAFDCHAYYYLLKPLDREKLSSVLKKIYKSYLEENKYHVIKQRNEKKRLKVTDIYYLEYLKRHIIYHLSDSTYEVVGKLSDVYNELQNYGFLQVHQGYIVNMDKIVDFDKFSVILDNGARVMISTRKRTEVLLAYSKYLEGNR